jgi:hypothetical protein
MHAVIRLLFVTLLFSSTYATAESVCLELDDSQGSGNMIHDQNNSNSNIDDQSECCDYYCQCIAQLGITFSYTLQATQTCISNKTSNYYQYYSLSAPPLLRPPIV